MGPLPSSQHPHPRGTLTAAGLAVGVQGVAPVAAAVVALLCVDTLVLTAWPLQRTVVDPWGEKGQILPQVLGFSRAVGSAPHRKE